VKVVLDASALLAFLQDEPGSDAVEKALAHAVISAVNWSEVIQKSLANGVDINGMRDELHALGLTVAPFAAAQAERASILWQHTREKGLSIADRACLATAQHINAPVFTTDRIWAALELFLDIHVIR
jgi:PIN domain nuclease of toxin-antitoxin system